jgi:hypothetical protein
MKGISYILEAFIASTFLLLALAFFFRPISTPDTSMANYKKLAYDGLKVLSDEGKLRQYVLDNDVDTIKSRMSPYISHLSYDVVIYNRTSNITAVPTITDNNVISVSYFFAGDAGNYSAREVRVFVWGFD